MTSSGTNAWYGGVHHLHPQTNFERKLEGLNPHKKAKNNLESSMVDNTIDSNPDQFLAFKTRQNLIQCAQRDYPAKCQYWVFVEKHMVDGVTYQAISEEMRCDSSTAQRRVERSLEFMKEYINEHE